ncbi:MAG: ABC transporter permease [Planctomycetaceae bacterium]|nr:ABC transporter permease [Planctomycetaceae bacterium]
MSASSSSLPSRSFVDALGESVAGVGATLLRIVEGAGGLTIFFWRTLTWLFTRWPRAGTLVPSMYRIGVESLPVVALIGTFIGMVLAVQSFTQFRAFGLETQLGGVINKSMFRELGPVLAATMLAGRVGSAIAAEVGTMRVTEQIDALASMGANPIHYLVVPRFLGCLLLIPSLTVMAMFMGVLGGNLYCTQMLGIDDHHYWDNANRFVESWDMFYGITKSVFFGATIGIVSCYRGFHCRPGAEGVGQAATTAFVYSFVAIIVLDLGLSIVLDQIYLSIWPAAPMLFGG